MNDFVDVQFMSLGDRSSIFSGVLFKGYGSPSRKFVDI
jgi:hypothetical protein